MNHQRFDNILAERARACMENIPVSINGHFGDPFQTDQWDNTLYKLKYLKSQNYKGEIEVSTKSIITDEQVEELYSINPNLWIFCGVTGLNEGIGISLEDRFDNYLRICRKMEHTVLNIRPLIPGKNDNMDTISPIIDVVAKGREMLKHGGYLNPNDAARGKSKYEDLKLLIKEYSTKVGVHDAPRCASMVSDITGRTNQTFAQTDPTNLDVLSALGYKYELTNENYVKLTGFQDGNTITKGDVSFTKILVQSSRVLDNQTDTHIYMQLKGPEGQYLACTSSWFHWAREVPCSMNCWYCHVRPGTSIYFDVGDSGCSPIDLYKHIFEQ